MKYEIQGAPMPVVICSLEKGEQMYTEGGSMVWMTDSFKMETKAGGAGKAFSRMFTGEKIFRNIYTCEKDEGTIAFASTFPGDIRVLDITPDRPVIVQKSAYLAGTAGVDTSIFFQKKLSTALFGGEGLIMQKLSGEGLCFVELDGSTVEYTLGAGEVMLVDTGNLAMCDATCTIEVQTVKGVKNVLFGGEGLFHTKVTGPGRIVLQTMPFTSFVANVYSAMPHNS